MTMQPSALSEGDRVNHGKFGIGTVIDDRERPKYRVQFDAAGDKHILAAFLRLHTEEPVAANDNSPRDIAVLAMAHQLERGGVVLLAAIGCAFEHLQEPPAEDAIFVREAANVSHRAGRFIADRDVARLPIDKTLILIPAGKIVAGITAACANLRAA